MADPIRRVLRVGGVAALIAGALATACRPGPSADLALGQTMIELTDAVSGLQQDNALLQAQIDSLRDAVARQDTLVRRLANMAGMPVP
jgi:capsid protein